MPVHGDDGSARIHHQRNGASVDCAGQVEMPVAAANRHILLPLSVVRGHLDERAGYENRHDAVFRRLEFRREGIGADHHQEDDRPDRGILQGLSELDPADQEQAGGERHTPGAEIGELGELAFRKAGDHAVPIRQKGEKRHAENGENDPEHGVTLHDASPTKRFPSRRSQGVGEART